MYKLTILRDVSLFALALGCALPSRLAAQTTVEEPATIFKAGIGFDYSKGDYGFTGDTEVFSSSLNVTAENSEWLLRAVIPYVSVKGPASIVGGAGPVFAAPARPTRSYQRGLGDIVTSATYHAHPSADGLNVDLTGRVKFPTSDEAKGLGTGETDFYAQTELYRRYGNITPFLTVGYRFMGDSPLYQLEDGAYASAGSMFRTGESTSVGASLEWRSRIVVGGEDAFEGAFFVTHNPNDRWNLIGYVLKGFSDASPDIGLGGLISYRF